MNRTIIAALAISFAIPIAAAEGGKSGPAAAGSEGPRSDQAFAEQVADGRTGILDKLTELRWKQAFARYERRISRGDYDSARTQLESILNDPKLPPDARPVLQIIRARTEIYRKDYDAALRDIEPLIRETEATGRRDEDLGQLYWDRGYISYSRARYPEALADYDRAIALRPNDADMRVHRAKTLIRLRRLSEAAGAFEDAVRLDPRLKGHSRTCGELQKGGVKTPSCEAVRPS